MKQLFIYDMLNLLMMKMMMMKTVSFYILVLSLLKAMACGKEMHDMPIIGNY